MTRMELVDGILAALGTDEIDKSAFHASLGRTLKIFNDPGTESLESYFVVNKGYHTAIQHTKNQQLVGLLDSDLGDDELETIYKFLTSSTGRRYTKQREENRKVVVSIWSTFTMRLAKHFHEGIAWREIMILLSVINGIRPDIQCNDAVQIVIDVTKTLPFPPADNIIAKLIKEKDELWEQLTDTEDEDDQETHEATTEGE